MKVLACINKNESTRLQSSSGGVFSLLAERILSDNGVVYGVTMASDCYSALYLRVTAKADLRKIQGSKYIQAVLGDTFASVKTDLDLGKKVLFSGTGCQVNGLKKFLKKEYSNLYCVDVVCHGAPSPALWRAYLKYQEEKFGKIENVNFRYKDTSWQNFGMMENNVFISKDNDIFMTIFLRDFCLRPACYNCRAKKDKQADISLADFWGIEAVAPEMNDGKGTSLVILRTIKGENLFESITGKVKYKEVTYEEGVRLNHAEFRSAYRPEQRDTLFKDLNTMPFELFVAKYTAPIPQSFTSKIKRRLKKIAKTIMSMFNQKTSGGDINNSPKFEYGMLLTVKNNKGGD